MGSALYSYNREEWVRYTKLNQESKIIRLDRNRHRRESGSLQKIDVLAKPLKRCNVALAVWKHTHIIKTGGIVEDKDNYSVSVANTVQVYNIAED